MRETPALALLLALTLVSALGAPAVAQPTRGVPGIFPGYLENQGYEYILADPDVDPAYGLVTTPGYAVDDVAISGDGNRIWFVLFTFFPAPMSPHYEVWSIMRDGSSAMQSDYGPDAVSPPTFLGNLFVRTDLDGDVAIFDSGPLFSRAVPGGDLEALFALDTPFGLTEGQKRVTDDGSRFLYLDRVNNVVHSVELGGPMIETISIAGPSLFEFMGKEPRSTLGFDMSADGQHWFTTAENHFTDIGRNRYWLIHGEGVLDAPAPDIVFENTPFDDHVLGQVDVSDLGQTMAYCPTFSLGEDGVCYVQTVGSSDRTEITEDGRLLGGQVLADNGNRLYVLSDAPFANSYGFFESIGRHKRRVGGTQRLSGTSNPQFSNVELSDDGSIMVAPVPLGLYVLHDAADIPPAFPQLSAITHRFEGDELVMRVFLNAPMGIERIFNLPLYKGLEPTRSVPQAENPLWRERSGGGVNWNTLYTEVAPDVWERRIPLDGKRDFLTGDYSMRVVVVDHTSHRTSYYDYSLGVVFWDSFESGDVTAWSGASGN